MKHPFIGRKRCRTFYLPHVQSLALTYSGLECRELGLSQYQILLLDYCGQKYSKQLSILCIDILSEKGYQSNSSLLMSLIMPSYKVSVITPARRSLGYLVWWVCGPRLTFCICVYRYLGGAVISDRPWFASRMEDDDRHGWYLLLAHSNGHNTVGETRPMPFGANWTQPCQLQTLPGLPVTLAHSRSRGNPL